MVNLDIRQTVGLETKHIRWHATEKFRRPKEILLNKKKGPIVHFRPHVIPLMCAVMPLC